MYLGLSQVEMTGSSVFDYTHQQDHEELAKQLGRFPVTRERLLRRMSHIFFFNLKIFNDYNPNNVSPNEIRLK